MYTNTGKMYKPRGGVLANMLRLGFTLLLVAIIAGCGAGDGGGGSAEPSANAGAAVQSTAPAATAPAASVAPTSGPITVKHALGEAVLPAQPQRVVYLFQGMLDVGAALGVKPVGAVESTDQKPWFKYLGDMSGVKSLGDEGQPNIETILALKPDLIIATKVRHEKIYPQLKEIAPTVVVEDLADWKDNLRIAGEALGKQAEAAKLLQEWDSRVAEFKQKMGDRLATTSVSMIRIQRDNSVKVYLKGFPGLMARELGLQPPKAQQVEFSGSGLDLMTKEHIPQLDADYIFDLTTPLPGQENVPELAKEWTSHPLWAELQGVKNGKYFKVDPITWNFGAGPVAAKAMLEDLFGYFGLK